MIAYFRIDGRWKSEVDERIGGTKGNPKLSGIKFSAKAAIIFRCTVAKIFQLRVRSSS